MTLSLNRRARGLLKVIGALLGAALVAWVFRGVAWSEISGRLAAIGLGGGLLVLLPALAAGLIESAGWRGIFAVIDARVGFIPLFRLRTETEAAAQTLPAGVVFAESLKVALLTRFGIGVDAAVTATLARKYVLMTSQSLYIGLSALFGFAALEALSQRLLGRSGFAFLLPIAAAAIGSVALGMRALLSRGRLATRARELFRRLSRLRRARASADTGSWSAAMDRRIERFFRVRAGHELAITSLFLGGWLLESVETFLLLRLVGVELDFGTAMAVEVVLSILRMTVFVVPGGLGVQEAGYAIFLHALAVPEATVAGAAFAVLKRAKEVAYALLGYSLLALSLKSESAASVRPALGK